jgi:hypothetical protein
LNRSNSLSLPLHGERDRSSLDEFERLPLALGRGLVNF